MADVTEARLVETFDQLANQGVIVYGPHETVKVEDDGYPVRKHGNNHKPSVPLMTPAA
jgi:hypothetical protein